MRLNKLTLESFVSFKDRTVIDFEQFGNKLLLLFGGSGTGKTTIFDGINFALYGKCSGTDRTGMSIESCHSDFAKDFEDDKIVKRNPVLVELEFEHNGKNYVAKRTITWGEKGTNKNFAYNSRLTEDGHEIAKSDKSSQGGTYQGNGIDEVSEKVEDLLGLNAGQFSQVVILAQGEFEKFLKADAKEREKILTRLMDNSAYQDFQERLHETKLEEDRQLSSLQDNVNKWLEHLIIEESTEEQEKLQYTSRDESILRPLRDNLDLKNDKLNELKQEKSDFETKSTELSNSRALGIKNNSEYDELVNQLDEITKKIDDLDKQKDNIGKLKENNSVIDQLVVLFPLELDAVNTSKNLEENEKAISEANNKISELEASQDDLLSKKQEAEKNNRPQIEEFNKKINQINDALPNYSNLESAVKAKDLAFGKLGDKKTECEDFKASLDKKKDLLRGVEEQLEELKSEGSAKVELEKNSLDKLKSRLDDLGKLKNAISEAVDVEREFLAANAALSKRESEENEALLKYNDAIEALERSKRQHKAGEIADFMRKELLEKQEVECPVCHTVHSDASKFEVAHQLPEEKEKEKAGQAYEKAHSKKSKAENLVTELDARLSEKIKNIDSKTEDLLGEQVLFENIKCFNESGNKLNLAIEACERKISEQNKLYDDAVTKAEEKKSAEESKTSYKSDIENLEKKLADAEAEKSDLDRAYNEAEKKVTEYSALLQGMPDTKLEANRLLKDYSKKVDDLQKEIDAAVNAYNDCENEISINRGVLSHAESIRNDLTAKAKSASDKFNNALVACGYADKSLYMNVVVPYTNLDGSRKDVQDLQNVRKENSDIISKYEADQSTYTNEKNRLSSEFANKKRIDLTDIESQLSEVAQNKKNCENKITKLSKNIGIHTSVLNEVETLFDQISLKHRAHEVLSDMDAVINGKLTFNRFVLIDLFRTMLDKANDRLNMLSSGQYELQPVLEGSDKKPTDGLAFVVHDCINQTNRLAGSNSGGEKFELSLSLALGLSDIIQSHGKKASRIESLFIDEGFGTLGKEDLDKTKNLLLDLSGGTRQIGIISHNPILEEAIKDQIVVTRDKLSRTGSRISYKKE